MHINAKNAIMRSCSYFVVTLTVKDVLKKEKETNLFLSTKSSRTISGQLVTLKGKNKRLLFSLGQCSTRLVVFS